MLGILLNATEFIIKIVINTPFYPHWLTNLGQTKESKVVNNLLFGNILEVGAGDVARKEEYCANNKKITKYVATDHDEWDEQFEMITKKASNKLWSVLTGFKQRGKLDYKCDAISLPFEDNSFDFHLSFQVLEHINDPFMYFEEAKRVVKKDGFIIVSVPFLYRIHGGEPTYDKDFFRYSLGFFYDIEKRFKLKIIQISAVSGVGTSIACLINQYIIRKAMEHKIRVLGIAIAILGLPIFFTSNILGYILDRKPDIRFATNLLVILKK